MKAPWKDFEGNSLFIGDIILHPSGEKGTIEFVDEKWLVNYGTKEKPDYSQLLLQIGDKGRAIKDVKKRKIS